MTAAENSAMTSFFPFFPARPGRGSAGRFPFISSQATDPQHTIRQRLFYGYYSSQNTPFPVFPSTPSRKYQSKRRWNPYSTYQWKLQMFRQSQQRLAQWWQVTASLLPAARGSGGTSGVRTPPLAVSR